MDRGLDPVIGTLAQFGVPWERPGRDAQRTPRRVSGESLDVTPQPTPKPMNIHRTKLTTASLAVAMLGLVPASLMAADRDATRNREVRTAVTADAPNGVHAAGKLRLAPEGKDDRTLRKVEGQKVRGVGRDDLGEVKDLLIEPNSGRVAFAVVATGGVLGVGETLRLVPFASLKRTPDREAFLVEMTEAQWKEMPIIEGKDYNEGNISVSAANQRAAERTKPAVATVRDGRTETRPIVADPDRAARREERDRAVVATERASTSDAGRRVEAGKLDNVIRSSKLRGKEIRAGGEKIGKIESVVLDWESGKATAVLDLDRSFTGTNRKFMIPVSELALRSEDQDVIVTNLTRADFQQIARGESPTIETRVTPTGRDRVDPVSPRTGVDTTRGDRSRITNADTEVRPALESAVRSARQSIGNHPSLRAAEVEIVAENGKMVLRGYAESEDMKERVEKAAQDGAPGIPFESLIQVRAPKR